MENDTDFSFSGGERTRLFLWFKVRFIRTYFHGGSKEDNL